MDEEELRKRFTDCVYFLASPLTCKKGIECEYRHSEIARLNPTDCWYWLAGSCFSPACAFRHPPLEGYKETYPESTDPNRGPALPANKTNIPCYFYLNGFCNKGERCSFLHGPDDRLNTHKSSKEISTTNNIVSSEKKLSPEKTNTLPAPTENHSDPFEQLAPKIENRSESPDILTNQSQETLVESNSLLPHEEFVQDESDVFTDQSSDEQIDGHVEREEWLESSPGFDVLVEGESVNARYDEDADYFPVHKEGRELNVHYSGYDHNDPIEYDAAYPELRNPLKEEKYENEAYYNLGKVTRKSRESIFYRLSSQKRNLYDDRRGSDLRDHLKRRKVFEDYSRNNLSKRHEAPRVFDHRIRRNPRRHGSHGEPFRDKKRPVPYLKPIVQQKKRRSEEESGNFTGPKTLDQIKEEKKKAQQNEDFKGPRPLNEILKNKRRLNSVVDLFGNSN